MAAYGRGASEAELQQWRGALNAAAAQGAEAVKAAAESKGRQLFAAQVSDLSIPAQQLVTNLYEGFLQRGPDSGGLSWWTGEAGTTVQSRQHVLDAFAVCDPFKELAGALYRETFWLVGDQLGTPRMVADKSGSLAGIKRHDYLPFGEELYVGTGGRATTQGYGAADNVRQQFTGYEHDAETELDYAQARYYASGQGRFISTDPGPFNPSDPQSWDRYTYVQNNPMKFVDHTGKTLVLAGDNAGELLAALEEKTGYKLKMDDKGKVSIDKSVKRNAKGTSKNLANLLKATITDSGTLKLVTKDLPIHTLIDNGRTIKEFYIDDYRDIEAKDTKLGAVVLAHVLKEGYDFVQLDKLPGYSFEQARMPHKRAEAFESRVLSDLTGQKEKPRVESELTASNGAPVGVRFEYTSITYDIYHKSFAPPGGRTVILVNNKNCGCNK